MRILVTGGAGYLGSEVCRQAVEAGQDVVATELHTRATSGRGLRLDVREELDFRELEPDVVVHTAYVMSDVETIVRGTRNVAAAAERAGARLVHISTDLVFDGDEGAPYREEDEPRPVSEYGRAKLAAEGLAGHDALIVRTSLLYGKPGPQEALAARGDVVFHEDEIRCPTHVSDLAAALLELAALDEVGVLHVAAPDAVSRLELARLLGARDPQGAPAPPGRARNVALDSSRAASLLATRLRGIREIKR
ncbi:MAG TPA: sugar nucleotide-binding protein [Gaiellaceae bacterium]|nr:sugar nucleotide-binding protein [Gaiellaceae bacterium]